MIQYYTMVKLTRHDTNRLQIFINIKDLNKKKKTLQNVQNLQMYIFYLFISKLCFGSPPKNENKQQPCFS